MRYWIAAIGLAAALIFAAACGDDDNDVPIIPGPNGETPAPPPAGDDDAPLAGATLSVGSKEFTEQLILGQITVLALENAGATVNDRTAIFGTDTVRTALTQGEIDMYWEYTGTGWSFILGREIDDAPASPDDLYDEVAQADLEENDIVWMRMSPLNNTYALATLASRAEEMGVTTISDYAELAREDPSQATLCGATEWLTRDDGYPGLAEAYDFDLPDNAIAEVEFAIIPSQVVSGSTCLFGEVFATDGTIAANDLVVLEDDLDYFVAYNVALTVRQEVYEQYGDALEEIFNPITELLTNETMQELNARVDVDGEFPEDVAEDFLRQNGFLN